jgi:hypothetical protein
VIRGVVAVFALCLMAGPACGAVSPATAPAATGQPTVNVTGVLVRGPMPTCPSDEPCDPPVMTMFLAFSRPGQPDVRVRVDASGAFALHLDPGAYSISAAPPPFNGRLEPSQVRVPEAGTVRLQLSIVRPPA